MTILETLLVIFWSLVIKLVAGVVYLILILCLLAIICFVAATVVVRLTDGPTPRNPKEPARHGP